MKYVSAETPTTRRMIPYSNYLYGG